MEPLTRIALFSAATLMLASCAGTRVVSSPSTKPLQTYLGSATQHVEQARTLAQRIHDKDVIIDMWHQQHPGQ